MRKKVVLIGAGKHGIVVAEKLLHLPDFEICGFIDKHGVKLPQFIEDKGCKVLGDDTLLHGLDKDINIHLCLGANSMDTRKELIGVIRNLKLNAVSVIHPSAYIAASVHLGAGVTVLVDAVINTNAQIGDFCCINTGAIVEHDCILGDNVFIQPRSVLAGNVSIGEDSIIGIGAVVRENIKIGKNCFIGGGAFVSKDIPDNSIAYGVPAKIVGIRKSSSKHKNLKD
ncbi:MAG: acetyltransferase [Nitrospirae bacterium]|nr:acetyltransferase [Nitrospirota bacterium]MBI3378808.1 acetyltransferase [Nitrospirota bacterium]